MEAGGPPFFLCIFRITTDGWATASNSIPELSLRFYGCPTLRVFAKGGMGLTYLPFSSTGNPACAPSPTQHTLQCLTIIATSFLLHRFPCSAGRVEADQNCFIAKFGEQTGRLRFSPAFFCWS